LFHNVLTFQNAIKMHFKINIAYALESQNTTPENANFIDQELAQKFLRDLNSAHLYGVTQLESGTPTPAPSHKDTVVA
jgi:hypothetical protein